MILPPPKKQICGALFARDQPGTSKQAAPLVRRLVLVVATEACSAKRSKSNCDENPNRASMVAYYVKKLIFKWLALSINHIVLMMTIMVCL